MTPSQRYSHFFRRKVRNNQNLLDLTDCLDYLFSDSMASMDIGQWCQTLGPSIPPIILCIRLCINTVSPKRLTWPENRETLEPGGCLWSVVSILIYKLRSRCLFWEKRGKCYSWRTVIMGRQVCFPGIRSSEVWTSFQATFLAESNWLGLVSFKVLPK